MGHLIVWCINSRDKEGPGGAAEFVALEGDAVGRELLGEVSFGLSEGGAGSGLEAFVE